MEPNALFPEFLPYEKPAATKADCCEAWDRFLDEANRHPDLAYEVVHAFAHGRIPFTLDALAERSGMGFHDAEAIVAVAVERDWVVPVWPEPYMKHPTLQAWIGALHRRR